MSCFGCFNRRPKSAGSTGPRGASVATTTTASASAVSSTSRSDDSGAAVRPVSKSGGSSSQHSISSLYEERGHGQLRAFEYAALKAATADFSRAQKLGEGGFGSVYKGFVRAPDPKADRVAVAVKQLNQRGLQVRTCSVFSFLSLSLSLLDLMISLSPPCLSLCPRSEVGRDMVAVTELSIRFSDLFPSGNLRC
jgi:hypothetical protein